MASNLIGLVGRKRVGKDTVAARLVEKHGFTRYAFADNVRRALLALDPIVEPGCDGHCCPSERLAKIVRTCGWEFAKEIPEVRRSLQHYGMAIREVDRDFWARPVLAAIAADDTPAVITDVRFRNEADAIRAVGGYLVRITRPGLDESDTHVSETELTDYPTDGHIVNSGALAVLDGKVDLIVSWI